MKIHRKSKCRAEEDMQRLPDIPAFRHASITSTERDLGPRVPTIFVSDGKKLCKVMQIKLLEQPLRRKSINVRLKKKRHT